MPLLLDLLYLGVLVLLSPWLVARAIRTGRYRRDLAAKLFGTRSVANPGGKPTVWFHGVSVGEIHLLGVVVAAFGKRHPDWHTVVSSTTDTGLTEAGQVPQLHRGAVPIRFFLGLRGHPRGSPTETSRARGK